MLWQPLILNENTKICWYHSFVVLQRIAKKSTKIYNPSTKLLVCSLHLLFDYIVIAVATQVWKTAECAQIP